MGPVPAFALLGSPGLWCINTGGQKQQGEGGNEVRNGVRMKLKGDKREAWKAESCSVSDSEAEACFYRGRVDRHFPSQNFGTIGQ